MKTIKLLIVAFGLIGIVGCATVTPDFAVEKEFWDENSKTIGIATAKLPKPAAHKAGAQGLLDVAINDSMSSDLDSHLAQLDIASSITEMTNKMEAYLRGKGYNVKLINEPIDLESLPELKQEQNNNSNHHHANLDFQNLRDKYGIDKLVLIKVVRIGTIRSYYSFIPTSDPSGTAILNGQVIDLANNELEWSQTVSQNTPNLESEWDEPPNFPGLTNAMFTAYQQSQNMLLNHFSQ